MKKFLCIYYVLLPFLCIAGMAQTSAFYSTDKELSSSLINAIYQDRRNYMWIATEDGLNKFDGVHFTVYRNNQNDSNSLKNNYVHCLYEDVSGHFWVGCINGLQCYDRITNTFMEVPLYLGERKVNPHITSIVESNKHEIWMTTSGQGIIRITSVDDSICIDESLSNRLCSSYLTCIYQDSYGLFWIGSENQGLNMYNPDTDELLSYQAPTLIGSNQISTICEDAYHNLFVGTLTNGLYRLNRNTMRFEPVVYPHKHLSVKSLFFDDKNRLLVGIDGCGVKMYDASTNTLVDFYMASESFDYTKLKVHAICQDHLGNLWFGLFQKGVFFYTESSYVFDYLGYKSYSRNLIGSGCVMSLLKDRDGSLWIGTDNDGLYCMYANGSVRHYKSDISQSSVPNTILAMEEDEEGNLWLGSYLSGLAKLDKRTGTCTYFHSEVKWAANDAQNKIFSLTKDKSGRLWIGTSGAGVYVFDMRKLEYVAHYSRENDVRLNDWINSVYCGTDGTVWIASYKGLFGLQSDTLFCVLDKDGGTLPGNVVYCVRQDHVGNLWIGTTEGLVCRDTKGAISTYTVDDGLPSNVICSILEDASGMIWLGTHVGISRFSVAERKFVNFYATDGLQGNEFSLGAAYKALDGELFFGGINGVSSFYPADITAHRIRPEVYLTTLYILDQPVVAGQKSGKKSVFNGFIGDADTLYLAYRDNMFAFEFSTFDFASSDRVRYSYRLDGFNQSWMNTETGTNRISFTNINYGTYVLRVKAWVYDSVSEEKQIVLIISPPWYLTWWAKLTYIIFFLFALWGVYKFMADTMRHKKELMEREHTERLNESKLQFFIDVSHEIRTPMTLIISPLENLIAENKDERLQKVYMMMYRNAQRILLLINQLMDVRKIDKGQMTVKFRQTDMVCFIDDVMQIFDYQAKKKHITFRFVHADEQLLVWIDMDNFDKILVNLLSNAFKFTPEDGEITITLTTGYDTSRIDALCSYYEIVISDTGCGIEEDKVEKIFERFYQIGNTPESKSGTGIGLHLSRSLIELQHGIIFARNCVGHQGSEFVIRLPLGNTHLSKSDMVEGSTVAHLVHEQKPLSDPVQKDEQVHSRTKYRVLIVDDEEEIRHYLRDILSPYYRISEAVNGKEALEFALREKPSLIISDVMMPEMDGITLCRKLKANVNVNRIPVILLTAKTSNEDNVEGLEVGADAYVVKPFNIELLKKQVTNILENRERLEMKMADLDENKAMVKQVEVHPYDQILYEKIIRIINENIADSDLNVEMLANGVGMSRAHMHRKLKELTNMSARDFIRSIRLKQAAQILVQQKMSISEVAYALGFSNLSHFSNSFRECYGMSPRQYTQEHASNALLQEKNRDETSA